MSIASSSDANPGLTVLSPEEALLRAQPLPPVDSMALGEVPDDEWDALLLALADG